MTRYDDDYTIPDHALDAAGHALLAATRRFETAQFDSWMRDVNHEIQRRTGLDADDLIDYCYRDEWDNGASPKQAARRAIRFTKEG